MEWVITFLTNREKQDDMQIYISYKQNTTYLNITHVIPPLCRVTSHHNTTRLIHFHIIHVLKDQNTISLNQSISINTQALCNRYTKTQSYMQCGIMSVKNLVGLWLYEQYRVNDIFLLFSFYIYYSILPFLLWLKRK